MAAESSAPAFRKSIAGFDRVVLLAGLGGKTGTNTLPSLVKTARDSGCDVLVAVTMPFSIESPRALAETALTGLRADGFQLVVHDHRAMEKLIPDGSMNNMIDAAAQAVGGSLPCSWLPSGGVVRHSFVKD